jgi:hypothetical protein
MDILSAISEYNFTNELNIIQDISDILKIIIDNK